MKFIDIAVEILGSSSPADRMLLNIYHIEKIRPVFRAGEVIPSSMIYTASKNFADPLITKLTLDELAELIALARKS